MKSPRSSPFKSCCLLLLAAGVAGAMLSPSVRGQEAKPAWPVLLAPVGEDAKVRARAAVQTRTLDSELMKRAMFFNLILPAGYETSGLRYPVVYLLHGSNGNHLDWNKNTGVAAYVSGLPLIIVMPDGGPDSRYINSPGHGPYADYILKELVPHIDASYRTVARREGRALAGLSMGGYGAWRLGMNAPENFASVASLSGSFKWGENDFDEPQYRERAIKVYGGSGAEAKAAYRADRIWAHLERHIAADGQWKGPALYFSIGSGDYLRDANRLVRQRLEERKVPFVYAEQPGAHNWDYWDGHVREALLFSVSHLAPPENVR